MGLLKFARLLRMLGRLFRGRPYFRISRSTFSDGRALVPVDLGDDYVALFCQKTVERAGEVLRPRRNLMDQIDPTAIAPS
jgi:hypothetical protein